MVAELKVEGLDNLLTEVAKLGQAASVLKEPFALFANPDNTRL